MEVVSEIITEPVDLTPHAFFATYKLVEIVLNNNILVGIPSVNYIGFVQAIITSYDLSDVNLVLGAVEHAANSAQIGSLDNYTLLSADNLGNRTNSPIMYELYRLAWPLEGSEPQWVRLNPNIRSRRLNMEIAEIVYTKFPDNLWYDSVGRIGRIVTHVGGFNR